MKMKVRKKSQDEKINQRTTGNLPAVEELNDSQQQVLSVMGNQTATGISGVPPSGFSADPSEND